MNNTPPAGHIEEHDPLVDGIHRLAQWVFGPDRATRSRTAAILLCAVMYAICCLAAGMAADLGVMRPFAPPLLAMTSVPAYLVFFGLVRSGRTRALKDPTLMVPQNLFALMAIGFAYTAVGPNDRGVVLVLLALVMVFGMYTHTPKQSAAIGVLAVVALAVAMAVLSWLDPVYYPPMLELIRFELLAGSMPVVVISAYRLSAWRERIAAQRIALRSALEQVQKLAIRDALTGLYNRRHMQDKLDHSIRRFDRYGERFAIALIDLDHFKQINDQRGHKAGDAALAAFAAAAGNVLRETDTVARWGGEEFLVLLPNATASKAAVAMQRLREALARGPLPHGDAHIHLRFSSGIAIHDAPGNAVQLLERADKALYQAKRQGRNRDVVAAGMRPAS